MPVFYTIDRPNVNNLPAMIDFSRTHFTLVERENPNYWVSMLIYIIIAFVAIPAIELVLLITLFRLSGWEAALGLIILTGLIGGYLAKRQGWQTWSRIKKDFASGVMPTTDLVHGLFILIAGALLLTPGILTDITGFILLIPAVRLALGTKVLTKFKTKVGASHVSFQHVDMSAGAPDQSRDSDVIDVDATVSHGDNGELEEK